jgi:DNA-3-methyladenine glycosylase
MRGRRHTARRDRDLASGPGKLTQALGITLGHYGVDLTQGEFVVREPAEARRFQIDVTPRIGITKCAESPLRFVIRPERL